MPYHDIRSPGLAPRGGEVSQEEIDKFLHQGGRVTYCEEGAHALSANNRDFYKAAQNGEIIKK